MGVLMHTFLCGTQPFEVDRVNSSSLSKYVTKVHEGIPKQRWITGRWAHVSATAIGLLERMLCVTTADRPTMQEVLGHPWMAMDIPTGAPAAQPVPSRVLQGLRSLAASKSKPARTSDS